MWIVGSVATLLTMGHITAGHVVIPSCIETMAVMVTSTPVVPVADLVTGVADSGRDRRTRLATTAGSCGSNLVVVVAHRLVLP